MRSLLNIVILAIVTPFFCLAAYVARIFDSTGDGAVEVARRWGRCVSWVTGMRVRLAGAERLRPDQPYVFMANHVSAADIWTLFAVLPVRVRMIAKKQLRAIPLFGWAMWAGRFIFIDRQNPAAARRSIADAEERIRKGESVLLFPEGTRSRNGRLGVFKKGGFHMAANAGVPIVPVAIRGTFELLPPDTWRIRPGEVTITVGEPIATVAAGEAGPAALLERVRGAIAGMLGETATADTAGERVRASQDASRR